MDLWILVITAATFVLLAFDTWRRWQRRPHVNWEVTHPAWMLDDGRALEVYDVTNSGNDAAVGINGTFVGATQVVRDEFRFPPTMPAHSTARQLLERGDYSEAYVRISWNSDHDDWCRVAWRPLDLGGPLGKELFRQRDVRLKRIRKRWRRLREEPPFVGPGGVEGVRIRRARPSTQRWLTAAEGADPA